MVICGLLWNDYVACQQSEHVLFVPYMLYFDAFDTVNPLGSHEGACS